MQKKREKKILGLMESSEVLNDHDDDRQCFEPYAKEKSVQYSSHPPNVEKEQFQLIMPLIGSECLTLLLFLAYGD